MATAVGFGVLWVLATLTQKADSGAVAFFVLIVAIAAGIGFYKFYNKENLPRLQDAYNKEMVAYNDALARWERSYYCSRCGHFFEWMGGVEPSRGFEWPKG